MSTEINNIKKINANKVYILKRKKYIPISFAEFSRRKENTHLYTQKKFIVVQGNLLEVTAKIYAEYYKENDHKRYLKRQAKLYNSFSLDALDAKDIILDSALITDELENDIEKRLTLEKLRKGMEILSDKEREVIEYIYFKNMTEQQMADCFGVSQQAIHKRKCKVLTKLKKFLEK